MRLALAAILVCLALATAACGGSDGEQAQSPAPSPAPAQPAAPPGEPASPAEPVPPPSPAAQALAELPAGRTTTTLTLTDGTALDVTLVIPEAAIGAATRPLLLAFPPGGQGQNEVEIGLDAYWAAEAQARGWIVASPAAPGGELFFDESARLVPELVALLTEAFPTPDGRVAVAGVSNGGKSAFRAVANTPELFASLVVLPGFPDDADDEKLAGIVEAGVPVTMYVGEQDAGWLEESQRAEADLEALGGVVSLTVVPETGHILRELPAGELFDALAGSPDRRYDGGPEEP